MEVLEKDKDKGECERKILKKEEEIEEMKRQNLLQKEEILGLKKKELSTISQNQDHKSLITNLENELRSLTKEATSSKVDFHSVRKIAQEKQ